MYAFASLTLSAVTFEIPCLDLSPSKLSVNLRTLAAGMITDLILSDMWEVERLMEALNGSALLPLLVVLELLGLKISWFPIRVGETVVATKVGLPQLADILI